MIAPRCCVIVFAAAAVLACAPIMGSHATAAAKTDVCTLIARPKDFERQLVTVTAIVRATTHYSMVLVDPNCNERTIILAIPDSAEKTADIEKLRAAVFAGYPHAPKTRTKAAVTGWFNRASGRVPMRTITATRIADVETAAAD